jgi:hypothetical protein
MTYSYVKRKGMENDYADYSTISSHIPIHSFMLYFGIMKLELCKCNSHLPAVSLLALPIRSSKNKNTRLKEEERTYSFWFTSSF